MIAIGSEITTTSFENKGTTALVNEPVTFGQAFILGDLPASGAAVELRALDGAVVPTQMDVKNTHPDGSVRFAILSAIIPSIPGSSTAPYSIRRASTGPTGAAALPSAFPGLNATVLLTDTGTAASGPQVGTEYTADAAALLAAGTYQVWLSGPIVSEWIVRAPLKTAAGAEHPNLHARFSIRAYAGQARAKIDYIVENMWAKPAAVPANSSPWEPNVSVSPNIYAFSLKAGTTTVHTRAVKGYVETKLTFGTGGVYDANATGIPNTSEVFTATITINGVAIPISMVGSSVQTYQLLRAAFNTQLGSAGTCRTHISFLSLLFESATTGPASTVTIDYGTLFPAMSHAALVGTTQHVPFRPMRGDEVLHRPGQRWKKTYWWGAPGTAHIIHNKTYLMASSAVPNYAPELVGDAATIAAKKDAILNNMDIGDNGITKAFMGDTGYAPGIGVLPEWAALYLVSQDADAKFTMLAQADLHAGWSCNVRDYATDRPLSFSQWPYVTYSPSAGDSRNPATNLNEKLPSYVALPHLPIPRNSADTAHHPDFCFLPYLVTGDHFYMEGVLFSQRWSGLSNNAHVNWRDGAKCLWKNDQTRGQAWSLRTTAHALYVMPDGHPLYQDVLFNLTSNLAWYQTNLVEPTGPFHTMFGIFWHGASGMTYDPNGAVDTGTAPWQNDFVTQAAGRTVELGYSQANSLLAYLAKNVVGRLTSGVAFCWRLATTFAIRYREAKTSTALYTSWAEVYSKTFTAAVTGQDCASPGMTTAISTMLGYAIQDNAMSGYPSSISGYPANTQPAAAYAASYDSPGGDDAWLVFDARAQKPDYNLGPQFAIVPRGTTTGTPGTPPPSTPTDIYSVASGLPIYGGRAA